MNAYVCTYRKIKPSSKALRRTREAAKHDPLLCTFLDGYCESCYDWGDDPSFFAAQHLLGDVRKASWGVCRRDVRNSLEERDVVVFFCGREVERAWHYHFVGFGTVLALVERKNFGRTRRMNRIASSTMCSPGSTAVVLSKAKQSMTSTTIGSVAPKRPT